MHFNETFTKLSIFYHSTKTSTYHKKMVSIRVSGTTADAKVKQLGEIDFDISTLVG